MLKKVPIFYDAFQTEWRESLDFPMAISGFHVQMVSAPRYPPRRGVTVIGVGVVRNLGTLYVFGKLPTYPSLKPILTLASHLGQNVGLGEW